MKIDLHDKKALSRAIESLRAGGVVMHPTETCYGFAVDVFNEVALKKLYALKGRDFNKPVSLLVDGLGMAQEFGLFSDKAIELAQKYWPGPLSIVVPRKKSLPTFLNSDEDFVSVRWSSNSFCDFLVSEFGGPITTTSANKSGEAPLYEALDIGADFLVDGGVLLNNKPSTVVKVVGDRVDVLRQGDLLVEYMD